MHLNQIPAFHEVETLVHRNIMEMLDDPACPDDLQVIYRLVVAKTDMNKRRALGFKTIAGVGFAVKQFPVCRIRCDPGADAVPVALFPPDRSEPNCHPW